MKCQNATKTVNRLYAQRCGHLDFSDSTETSSLI